MHICNMYIDKILFTYLYSNTHLQLLGEERRRGDGVGEEVLWGNGVLVPFFFLLTDDDFIRLSAER